MLVYPPLQLRVQSPVLELRGATDELVGGLLPAVRAGIVGPEESPFDDPMSLYADSPEREWRWLQAIWAARARVTPDAWRLCFVVVVEDAPVGIQDVIAIDFTSAATVATYSWLIPGARGHGLGTEMRAAALELSFAGLGASEARSAAFLDNPASNGISAALGYERDGTEPASRRGRPAVLQRWRLTRERWESHPRDDITLHGVGACRPVLGLP